jgi:hypothetical protein
MMNVNAVAKINTGLRSRLLVRYIGTEPAIRFSATPSKSDAYKPRTLALFYSLALAALMALVTAGRTQEKTGVPQSKFSPAVGFPATLQEFPASGIKRSVVEKGRWNRNIFPLASSGQDDVTMASPQLGMSFYGNAMKTVLTNHKAYDVTGWPQAHLYLRDKGYYAGPHPFWRHIVDYPADIPRKKGIENSWQIDVEKKRFAVLFRIPDTRNPAVNAMLKGDIDNLENLLKAPKLFNLQTDQVKRYDNTTLEDLKAGLKWIGKLKRDNPGCEIYVAIAGHGETPRQPDSDGVIRTKATDKDGEGNFILSDLKLSKQDLQDLVNAELGEPDVAKDGKAVPIESPVLIQIISCQSGGAVAIELALARRSDNL